MASAKVKNVHLRFIETSDVHGSYLPFDYMNNRPAQGSMERVYAYLEGQRELYGRNLIYLDNGDILQGQPASYYYNYIDTVSTHFCSDMLNFMKCDVATVGNHDIETGHIVYDRWIRQNHFPVIAANVIDKKTGEPYMKPYVILEREGVRIAVFGLISPAIPNWLPEQLWEGLRFEDMEACARKWMPVLKEKEKADVIIGLFHAGREGGIVTKDYKEDATLDVARNVPGFDIIFFGHDHTRYQSVVMNVEGDSVLCINPANNAQSVGEVSVDLKIKNGKVIDKKTFGRLVDVRGITLDNRYAKKFAEHFAKQEKDIHEFVNQPIGEFDETVESADCFFGPSAFMDLVNDLQMKISGAQISFSAPLSKNAKIEKGMVYMRDMFNLYKYENMLYTMRLKGSEVRDHLEMSYDIWTNQMKSADDHILLFADTKDDDQRAGLKNLSFNFDCALGINYTVDVTKPEGQKVVITSLADGSPFDLDAWYTVAINSYRGNGGGELLTKGAKIPQQELTSRIIKSTEKDLRYYLMEYIKKEKHVTPRVFGNWKFVPEEWVEDACKRDRKILFGI